MAKLPPKRRPIGLVLLVLALVAIWVALWQRDRILAWFDRPAPEAAVAAEAPSLAEEPLQAPALTEDADAPVEPADCAAVAADWQRLCAEIDARAEAEGLEVGEGSCRRFDAALDALAASRPIVAGEGRDPARLLANATHLFRAAGRSEVGYAARLLRLQGFELEPIAATLFAHLDCQPERQALLYDYAVFGFSTLGGQGYLRRRSPRAEALATYYGVVVIDRAEADGRNVAGFDPRRELSRARELIQGQPLELRDDYLDRLDAIDDRWRSR